MREPGGECDLVAEDRKVARLEIRVLIILLAAIPASVATVAAIGKMDSYSQSCETFGDTDEDCSGGRLSPEAVRRLKAEAEKREAR